MVKEVNAKLKIVTLVQDGTLATIIPRAHLFWRTGQEARLLHVQQLLDTQHDSFSAGLSKLLLFVTQGQAEAQVQVGALERTKQSGQFFFLKRMNVCVNHHRDGSVSNISFQNASIKKGLLGTSSTLATAPARVFHYYVLGYSEASGKC